MKDNDEIDEFAAAALVQMSPSLLSSFSSWAPKRGESRKLPFNQAGMHRTYSRKELLGFDEYLRKPWPAEDGKRPRIPSAIQEEVKNESALQCAICHSNRDTCEVAHIEPVALSRCNHPHNLILLCANHHTKFDKQGVWGPREEAREFVDGFKKTLLYVTRVKWSSHASSIAECFSIAQLCRHLKTALDASPNEVTSEQLGYYERLADEAVARLKQCTIEGQRKGLKQTDIASATPDELWAKLEISVQMSSPRARLASAADLTLDDEFRAAAGFVDCPLCKGVGFHGESDCPVCCGERQVDVAWAESIDLEPYKLIHCPLCKGTARHGGEDCPICHGDRMIEHRLADQVDLADFEDVDCPLCKGDGRWEGDVCLECHGELKMPRHIAARVDLQAYEIEDCPVCGGDANDDDGDPCQACNGEGQMTRGQRDSIEVSDYQHIKCRLCKGARQFLDGDCPACSGAGTIPRWADDRMDWSQFDMVQCPPCRGTGVTYYDACSKCAGEGCIFRRYAEGY